jgi:hypothetical protein
MKVTTIVFLVLKLIALTILYFLCFAIASAIAFPPSVAGSAQSQQANTALLLLTVCVLNTMVLAFVILRSRWAGLRLSLVVFIVLFGVTTIMSQIETAVFVTHLPPGMLPRIVLLGAIIAAIFSPLSVLILGKRKQAGTDEPNSRLELPTGEWLWKLSLIAVAYLVLYFTFGYFIAWRTDAVREYYGGTDSGNFFAEMRKVLATTPWLPLFQILRAMMWTALALPVIRMMKGKWWEAGLAVALLFSVVMNSQLLLPNAFMPPAVRTAHMIETASSNFLFAWFLVWLLLKRPNQTLELQGS